MTNRDGLSIEQMREIVKGAPEGAEYFALVEELYYKSGMPFMVWAGTAWIPDSCVTRIQNILEPVRLSGLLEKIEQQKEMDILLAEGRAILEWAKERGHD